MVNNDILRRVRYALNIKDRTMLDIFKYGENPITHEELLNLLKREGEEEFLKCSNKVLEAFLDGLIILKRGKQEPKDGKEYTPVKITKNKVAPPFKEASFQIMYGKGITRVGEIFELAVDNDVVSKSGTWFSFGDIRLGQGKENVKNRLEVEKELFAQIEEKVLEILKSGKQVKKAKKVELEDNLEIEKENFEEIKEDIVEE